LRVTTGTVHRGLTVRRDDLRVAVAVLKRIGVKFRAGLSDE
jgi:hypothetical protein